MYANYIDRPQYINQLKGVLNTPDIKIVTGIRRSGKSKLLNAFADYIRQVDPAASIVEIDLTKLRFERLKDYHALNEYVEEHYKEGVNNYLMIDPYDKLACRWFAICTLKRREKGSYRSVVGCAF